MCTQYLHHIHLPTPPPHIFPPPTGTNLPGKTCSAHLFCDFVKEQNDIFVCLDNYTGCFIVSFPCIITRTVSWFQLE
jgi:hypothetical protein